MASEKPESGGFLAVIDAKIAALQQLRESLIAAVSIGALGGDIDLSQLGVSASGASAQPGSPSPPQKGPIDLPTGVFRGKGLSDAIRMYLGMAKRKQTNQEIKGALMTGGLATTSDFFDQTLSSTLHRMRKKGELLQFKDGWDLAASYPESFRQRHTEAKEPAAKGGAKKRRAARKKAATAKTAGKSAASKEKPAPKPQPVEPAKAAESETAAA